MSFKLVAILSVIVLAAPIQVHGLNENTTFETEYLPQLEILLQVEKLVELIGNEIEESLLQNITGVTGVESFGMSEEYSTQAQSTSLLKNLLEKLKELVEAALNKLRQFIEFAKIEIKKAADKVVTLAKEQLQAVADALRKELDELKRKAEAAGKDISECLDENEARLLELPMKYSGEVIRCLSKEVLEVGSHFEDVLKQGHELYDKLINIREDIDKCEPGFMGYICIAKLIFGVAKDIVTLPAMIEADIILAQKVLSEFKDNVTNCGLEKVSDMVEEGNEIVTAIEVCSAVK